MPSERGKNIIRQYLPDANQAISKQKMKEHQNNIYAILQILAHSVY